MYITKETKLQLSCRFQDNSYATGPVLITTKTPGFHHTQGSSTPNNLMVRVKTMWPGTMSFRGRPLVPLKRLQTVIFGFSQKETGAKGVAMATIK